MGGGAILIWQIQRIRFQRLQDEHKRTLQAFVDRVRRANRTTTTQIRAGEVSEHLCCTITAEPFEDPVMCADGHTYERSAIQQWFAEGHRTSPQTNVPLTDLTLTPNFTVRRAVQELSNRLHNIY